MKKMIVGVAMAVVLCGVSSADWATDYAKWKALPLESRFISTPQRAQITGLVNAVALTDLDQVVADISAVVHNEKADVTVRAYAADFLAPCYSRQLTAAVARNDKKQAQIVWGNIGKLADVYRVPAFSFWAISGFQMRVIDGDVMVKAGFLAQPDLDADLAGRISSVPMETRLRNSDSFPQNLRPTTQDVLAHVKANSQYAEQLPGGLTFLSNSYASGQLTAKDYGTTLKGVIMASVGRMNVMAKDDPARQPLLDAISGVKTSLKQLQEIEGTL